MKDQLMLIIIIGPALIFLYAVIMQMKQAGRSIFYINLIGFLSMFLLFPCTMALTNIKRINLFQDADFYVSFAWAGTVIGLVLTLINTIKPRRKKTPGMGMVIFVSGLITSIAYLAFFVITSASLLSDKAFEF